MEVMERLKGLDKVAGVDKVIMRAVSLPCVCRATSLPAPSLLCLGVTGAPPNARRATSGHPPPPRRAASHLSNDATAVATTCHA